MNGKRRFESEERLIEEIAKKKGVTPEVIRKRFEDALAKPVSRKLCIDPDDFSRPEEITSAQWKHVDDCAFCQILVGRIRMVSEELLTEREKTFLDRHTST